MEGLWVELIGAPGADECPDTFDKGDECFEYTDFLLLCFEVTDLWLLDLTLSDFCDLTSLSLSESIDESSDESELCINEAVFLLFCVHTAEVLPTREGSNWLLSSCFHSSCFCFL